MPPRRVNYVVAALGFVMLSIGAAGGRGPSWPSNLVWSIVGGIAAVSLLAVAARPTMAVRRLAASTVVVASGARLIGWFASEGPWIAKVNASGVWLIVASLMFLAHYKARRLQGSE